MSLWFQPKPRSVVYCDFTGFRMPEMTKRRPVIVLRAHKRNRRLVYVIPLSTSPPDPPQPYHYRFACSPVVHSGPTEAWAKCDMVAVVSTERLTLSRQQQQCSAGRARDNVLMISEEEFAAIRACVAKAFGFAASSYICDALTNESKITIDEI
jgi:uncharacterized protein YifN (PemK superfamily)